MTAPSSTIPKPVTPTPPAAPAPKPPGDHRKAAPRPLFEGKIVRRAAIDSLKKLDPRHMIRNPVMFVVEIGSVFTTVLALHATFAAAGEADATAGFAWAVSLWLWFTVLFANFAEAMAEGRGKAQADTLRKARKDISAKKLASADRTSARGRAFVDAQARRHRARRGG